MRGRYILLKYPKETRRRSLNEVEEVIERKSVEYIISRGGLYYYALLLVHDLEFQTNVDSLSESLMPDLEAFDIDTERPAWTKIVSEVENIYQFVTEGKKIIIDRLLLPELSFGQKSDEIRLDF
jgi:hypothetical protein